MGKSVKNIVLFGVLGVLFLSGFAAQENQFSTPHAKGLIPLDAERVNKIEATWPRVDRVNLNWLGLERINKVKALKGKTRLDSSAVRPVGQEVESSIHAPGVSVQAVGLNEDLLGDLPVSVDNSLLPYFPPIRSQGSIGSCVSFATTYYQLSYMTAFQRGLNIRDDGDNTNKYSPKWTYNMVNHGADNGSYFDDNYYLLEWHGAATWAEFPYDDDFRAWCLNTSAWRNALSVKPQTHQYANNVSTDSGLELAKELLTNGYILVIGTYIDSWQGTIIQDDPLTADDDDEVGKGIGYWVNGYVGPHAMTIVGYNDAIWTDVNGNGTIDTGEKGAFRVANSWGIDWMDAGFVWASYDALRSVSAVPDPSVGRIGALQNDRAYILTARANYSPTVIGELTLNHAQRYQLGMSIGQSDTSVTEPQTGWIMFGFYQQGGAYAFDGTTTAVDGTFVFDYTDVVIPGEERRYYVQMWDQASGDPAVLSYFKLIDTTTDPDTEVLCTLTPLEADNETANAYVDHTYTGPAYNNPPALTYGYVSPTSGTTASTFSFYVNYDDSFDGNAPTVRNVYIDETPYAMALYSGSASYGLYRYQTVLDLGTHSFRFHFEDGNGGSAQYPPTGAIDGPIVVLAHTVSQPSVPSGETNPVQGTAYAYSTGGSSCIQGHDIQYRFDWGDGVISDWLPVGQTSATHAWSSYGPFSVMAQARCSVVTATESSWSAALSIYVDPVIPFTESFSNSSFPDGWTQQNIGTGITNRWAVRNTSYAGGQAYEMRCVYEDINPGTTRLVTPPIDTTGYSSLRLSFKHFLNAYAAGPQLKVQSSPDGSTWTDEVWTVTSTGDDIPAETVNTVLTHNLNIETTYVAFVITGNLYDFDYWYIDDVSITRFVPKVDFNKDSQEDILWRYYGTGGRNRAWFLGDTGVGTIPLTTAEAEISVDSSMRNKDRASRKALLGARDIGMNSNRKVKISVKDPKDAVSAKNWKKVQVALAGDQRKAEVVNPEMDALPPLPGVVDPGFASEALGMATDAVAEVAATGVLSGADIPAVSDLTWQIVGTGDFNKDGNVDVLWRYNGTGGRVRVWYMNGTSLISGADITAVSDLSWQIVGTGDFNRDGKVDILWRYNGTGGRVRVWYMNGISITSGADISSVADLNWQVVGTGDFNKDGNVDILWRYNGAGGRNRVWYMNGISIISGADLMAVSDLNWQIAGTGDYNKDGNMDVLWRYNGSGGYVYIWYLNGLSWTGTEKLSPVPDLLWRIVSR